MHSTFDVLHYCVSRDESILDNHSIDYSSLFSENLIIVIGPIWYNSIVTELHIMTILYVILIHCSFFANPLTLKLHPVFLYTLLIIHSYPLLTSHQKFGRVVGLVSPCPQPTTEASELLEARLGRWAHFEAWSIYPHATFYAPYGELALAALSNTTR